MIIDCGCGAKIQADSIKERHDDDVSLIYYKRFPNGTYSVVGVKRKDSHVCGKCNEKHKERMKEKEK